MNKLEGKVALVFGGTGFLGRSVVRRLAQCGARVRVVTRVPESIYKLRLLGEPGQITPVICDYFSNESVAEAVRGCDLVVNSIGILFEKRKKASFQRVHVEFPAILASACMEEGVERFVHVSALGCNAGISCYARSKLEGEKAVISHYPKATIIRPSVIFGAGDRFFNMFYRLGQVMPFMPLIGGGKTRLQPVFVGDVAEAIICALDLGIKKYMGNIYHLGGPEVMNFREIYEFISEHTGRNFVFFALSFKVAKYLAWFAEFMPRPILTRDQVNSLKTDSVVSSGAMDFRCFNIAPKSVSLIVPEYLG